MKFFKKGLIKKLSLLQRILILKQGNSSFFIADEDFQFILDSNSDFNELSPLLSLEQAKIVKAKNLDTSLSTEQIEKIKAEIEKSLSCYNTTPLTQILINDKKSAVLLKQLPYLPTETRDFLITLVLAKIALVEPYQRTHTLRSLAKLTPYLSEKNLDNILQLLLENNENHEISIQLHAKEKDKALSILQAIKDAEQYYALLDTYTESQEPTTPIFYKEIKYICAYLAEKYPEILESYFKKHLQQIQNNPTLFLSFANAIHSSIELESLKPVLKKIFIANDFSSSLLFEPLSNLFFYLTRTQANSFLQTLKDHFPAPSAIKAFIKIMPDLDEDELIMLIDALLSKTPNEPKLTIAALIQFCELNQKPDIFLFIVSRTNTALTSSVDRVSNIVKKALIRYMLAEDNKNISNNKLTLGKVIEDYAMTTKTENPDFIVVKAIANLCNLTNNLECGVFRNN
ncbi:MAG: hypothetical protein LCH30_06165 [Proteobacteria bacterium]|nr:hypothetical protein [Pseudomonadota bacterium]